MALSEVFLIENGESCDLPVFGEEEESGLLLCGEGLILPPCSEPLGEYEGGGLATDGGGGTKDGTGGILSWVMGDGAGLE